MKFGLMEASVIYALCLFPSFQYKKAELHKRVSEEENFVAEPDFLFWLDDYYMLY